MAESTIVACPACGKKYQISSDTLGRTFQCANCQTQFQAGAEQSTEVEPPELQFAGEVQPPPFNPSPLNPPFNPGMQPPPMMNYNSGGMQQPKTSGMAIASLVCGILFCVPFCSLLALIFGIIGITQTKPGMARGRGMAIAGTVLGGVYMVLVVPMLLISILLPSLNKARETANRAKCASNMHQIGLAILLYQNENRQEYPPDLTTLVKNEQLAFPVFVCPSSNDTPATTLAELETGGHCSYKYLYPGPGSQNVGSTTAVLYENSSDHMNDGTNILFGDGHVEWLNRAAARQFVNIP
jgi:prepilin-type processing-associated H-X9-DG protein